MATDTTAMHHVMTPDNEKASMPTSTPSSGHGMAKDDPDNPQNFPLHRKIYVSLVASAFTFTLLFGLTSYTAGLSGVVEEFGVTTEQAILGLSVYIFGIIPAPLVTPHISERVGRNTVYFAGTFIMSLFVLGASRAQTFSGLLACRFFSGLFGGPIAVNIEGSYADVWPAMYTGSYYTFITASQYLGAATGAILGGTLVVAENWRWTQYVTLMLALAALLLGIGVPETYPREIIRQRARRMGRPHSLPPAQSGVGFTQMARLTLVQPFMMLISDPITGLIALYLSFNFGVLFQWFITVPATLNMLVGFDARQAGLVFIVAIGGTVTAGVCTIIIDQIFGRRAARAMMTTGMQTGKDDSGAEMSGADGKHMPPIEHRVIPAIIGSVLLAASVFWVGNTVTPAYSFYVPVVGNFVYVWGSAMTLTGFIGYLFDAHGSPPAILSTLSVVAYTRLATAGWLPLVILSLVGNLSPKWGFNLLGFIATALIAVPVVIFLFGARMRASSKYNKAPHAMSPIAMEMEGNDLKEVHNKN